MKKLLFCAMGLALLTGTTSVMAQDNSNTQDQRKQLLEKYDEDGDGVLNEKERQKARSDFLKQIPRDDPKVQPVRNRRNTDNDNSRMAQESKGERGISSDAVAWGGVTIQRPATNWEYYLLSQLQYNSELKNQLELSDGQLEKLKSMAKEMQAEQSEISQQYRNAYKQGNYQQAQAEYMKKLNDFKTRYVEAAGEILLDQQMTRLKQISRQQNAMYSRSSSDSSSRYYGYRYQDGLDLPVKFAKELELSEEEVAKLTEEIEKNRKEIADEINRLQEEAMKNVLGKLSPAKREKLKDLVGKPYDFQAAQQSMSEEVQKQYRQRQEEAKKKEK